VLTVLLIAPAVGGPFRFPAADSDYGYFYPTAYYDEGGVTDWACGGETYSGHRGSDFGVGSWEGMDAGRDIVAAADGVVLYTNDGEYDECSTGDCAGGGGYGNYVWLQHGDGSQTIYGHMKQWSVAVAPGDSVTCGQHLGQVGSSGYSTGPHLHFEVRDASGNQVDPFSGSCSSSGSSRWVDQGDYLGLPSPVCADTPECEPVELLTCGDARSTRNDAAGSTSTHAAYGCVEWVYTGPELAWQFHTSLDETVQVSLSGLSADLDLFVLDDSDCDASGCLGASDNSDASDEQVSFSATAGHVYTIVVDGWEGATSDLSLSISCGGVWDEGDGGATDGGATDGGTTGDGDGAATDGGTTDGGTTDGGATDTGTSGDGGDWSCCDDDDPPPGDPPGDAWPLDALPGGCASAPPTSLGGLLLGLAALVGRSRRRPG